MGAGAPEEDKNDGDGRVIKARRKQSSTAKMSADAIWSWTGPRLEYGCLRIVTWATRATADDYAINTSDSVLTRAASWHPELIGQLIRRHGAQAGL